MHARCLPAKQDVDDVIDVVAYVASAAGLLHRLIGFEEFYEYDVAST